MKETRRGIYLGGDRRALLAKLESLVADLAAADFPHQSSIPVVIDKWKVGKREVPCLLGNTFGHPNIFDGGVSISSELFYFDPEGGIARTLSRYRLGIPSTPRLQRNAARPPFGTKSLISTIGLPIRNRWKSERIAVR
ncbi:hypothetical protein [Rhizobium binae]|uniref:hypothetical protein n=1 Tax=Rhizobium binae TaxID=1138190 RepID=UPI001C828D9E|nr:hypothetical protein [Rhizobium binae]MBX4962140.1 hypothetical protein [Rhizobium binae]